VSGALSGNDGKVTVSTVKKHELAGSPTIRRYPHRGFSRANRTTNSTAASGEPRRDAA
jgi:hypothetical protein